MKKSTKNSVLSSFDFQRKALRITNLGVFAFLVLIVLQYREILGVLGIIGVLMFIGLIMVLKYIHKTTKIKQAEEKQQKIRDERQANNQMQNIATSAANSDL